MISKKKLYIHLGVICLLLCVMFVILALPQDDAPVIQGGPSEGTHGSRPTESSRGESNVGTSAGTSAGPSEGPFSDQSGEEPGPPYDSPVQFDDLRERCGDIYAWLEIPGAEISYPVAQSLTDDTFYLNHSIDGKEDKNGTLYTEHTYNSLTFSDPATIIYGHNMRSGAMFGNLQELFSDPEWFASHEEIIIYQPERELHYRVFAAVPYGTKHILYQYRCFRDRSVMAEFLDVIYSVRKFGTNYRKDCAVSPQDDRLLILSTCLPRSADGRYLVLAVLENVVGKPLELINE